MNEISIQPIRIPNHNQTVVNPAPRLALNHNQKRSRLAFNHNQAIVRPAQRRGWKITVNHNQTIVRR